MEETLGVAQAREALSALIERVQLRGERFIISRHRRPAAVLVPLELYERWRQERAAFFSQIRQLQARSELDPAEVMDLALDAQQAIRDGACTSASGPTRSMPSGCDVGDSAHP